MLLLETATSQRDRTSGTRHPSWEVMNADHFLWGKGGTGPELSNFGGNSWKSQFGTFPTLTADHSVTPAHAEGPRGTTQSLKRGTGTFPNDGTSLQPDCAHLPVLPRGTACSARSHGVCCLLCLTAPHCVLGCCTPHREPPEQHRLQEEMQLVPEAVLNSSH